MADEKKAVKTTKQEGSYKLKVGGPAANNNGAEVLTFKHDDQRQTDLSLVPGQVLTVGEGEEADLSAGEAERLQNTSTWTFEKVK